MRIVRCLLLLCTTASNGLRCANIDPRYWYLHNEPVRSTPQVHYGYRPSILGRGSVHMDGGDTGGKLQPRAQQVMHAVSPIGRKPPASHDRDQNRWSHL